MLRKSVKEHEVLIKKFHSKCVQKFIMFTIPPPVTIRDNAALANLMWSCVCIEEARLSQVAHMLHIRFFESS